LVQLEAVSQPSNDEVKLRRRLGHIANLANGQVLSFDPSPAG
jgi:hypothetical protein